MRISKLILLWCLVANFALAEDAADCGNYNGARCKALDDSVIWQVGPGVWHVFMRGASPELCRYKFDEGRLVWKCSFESLAAGSFPVLTGPCLELETGSQVIANLDAVFDLHAPMNREDRLDETGELIADYPCFSIKVELAAGDQDKVVSQTSIDFAEANHRHQIQLVGPVARETSLKCLNIQVWASNRLKQSRLSGVMTFVGAQIAMKRLPFRAFSSFSSNELELIYKHSLVSQRSLHDQFLESKLVPADSSGGYRTSCELRVGIIEGFHLAEPFLVEFVVDYRNSCTGSPMLWGVMASQESFSIFKQGERGEAIVSGFGPLVFVDLLGTEYTKQGIFSQHCSLKINNIDVRAAEQTIKTFENDLDRMQALLESQRSDLDRMSHKERIESEVETAQNLKQANDRVEEIYHKWAPRLELIKKARSELVSKFETLLSFRDTILAAVWVHE